MWFAHVEQSVFKKNKIRFCLESLTLTLYPAVCSLQYNVHLTNICKYMKVSIGSDSLLSKSETHPCAKVTSSAMHLLHPMSCCSAAQGQLSPWISLSFLSFQTHPYSPPPTAKHKEKNKCSGPEQEQWGSFNGFWITASWCQRYHVSWNTKFPWDELDKVTAILEFQTSFFLATLWHWRRRDVWGLFLGNPGRSGKQWESRFCFSTRQHGRAESL